VLDLRLIRSEPELVRAALARRGADGPLDRVLALDERRRALLTEVEALRAEQNQASEAIAAAKRAGDDAADAIGRMREVAARVKAIDGELAAVQAELDAVMTGLPNIPAEDAPAEDTVIKEVGEARRTGRDHLELAGPMIDMERGAKVSGSRFAYLLGDLVVVELALVGFALDLLRGEGFEPVVPPALVRERALFGTGFLPDTEQQIYRVEDEDLYLIGTSEVPLASLHADEILAEDDLPRYYAGFSPCFRREAGAAGKDTRGIFRVHQFDKVEMFVFCAPDDARAEHERLLSIEERILQALALPYRVVNIAVDDLGASAAKKYDCEAWLPGQGRYRELTSTSNTTDFQARRLDIRYRPAHDRRPRHVATLNGTAVAVGRTIIALLENGQRDDGSVELPAPLVERGAPARIGPAPA
jgi:seryl-tRNA synthetase